MITLKKSILVFMLALCLPLAAWAQTKGDTLLISHQDIIKAVSQAKGKVVVVNFWASWCPPCRMEIPEFIEARKRIDPGKLLMIGVSVDQDPSMFAAFAAKAGFNYPVYLAKSDVMDAFGIVSIPRTVVYGPNGEQALAHDGFMSKSDLEALVAKLVGL